ncbi:hypothetical protein [Aureimonas sp. ME7]|uniref:hypothetical protein n=1 Tax=Aureimonas sp. ME7 TaxID=2744252 RepID=UPI0015F98816|nr:hypothetical protein [Aureimonas sp. ME7]
MLKDLKSNLMGSFSAPSELFSFEPPASVVAARRAVTAAQTVAVMTDARALGTAFGLRLFGDTVNGLLTQSLTVMEDIPSVLATFEQRAHLISAVNAMAGSNPSDVGYAHWSAARAAYAGEILKLVATILEGFAQRLGYRSTPPEWLEDLSDVVLAFVFPGFGEAPKDDAWREDCAMRYQAIRLAAAERDAPSS